MKTDDKEREKERERELLKLLQEDLDGNFDQFFEWYGSFVWPIVLRNVQQREDAEDVFQEICISSYRHLKRYGVNASSGSLENDSSNPEKRNSEAYKPSEQESPDENDHSQDSYKDKAVDKLKSWMSVTARNACAGHWKKIKQKQRQELSIYSYDDEAGEEREIEVEEPDNLEDTIIRDIAQQKIRDAISTFPKQVRIVMDLLYLQGHTNAAIARELKLSGGTVNSIINRNKRRLLEKLINPDSLSQIEHFHPVIALYLQGYTIKKIAEQLGRPIKDIKSTLRNDIRLLTELSEDY